MAWYGVHVIMGVRFKDGNQNSFPAWENVYLVEAEDSNEAEAKAEEIGQRNEGDSSGTFRWNERPAAWVYVGVRKAIEISNPKSSENKPEDGAEVTYQTLEFDDQQGLQDYARGETARLTVID